MSRRMCIAALASGACCAAVQALAQPAEIHPQDPVEGLIKFFDRYRIVMLGELHENSQQWELIRRLIEAPGSPRA